MPYFATAFLEAADGQTYCCPRYPNPGPLYRKEVLKAMAKADLEPWPKLFQNCCSSRETELAERFPIQVVCNWIGNRPEIASRHYLQLTEQHFAAATENAVQNPVQYTAECGRRETNHRKADDADLGFFGELRSDASTCNDYGLHQVGATGLEPVTSSL